MIKNSNFGPWRACPHSYPCFPANIDNESHNLPIGENAASPESVLKC